MTGAVDLFETSGPIPKRRSSAIAYVVVVMMLTYYTIEPVLTLLWLHNVTGIVWVSKTLNVAIVFGLTIVLCARGRIVVDSMTLWLTLMLVTGVVVSAARGNSIAFAIPHFYYLCFALVIYTAFRTLPLEEADLMRLLRWSSHLLFVFAVGSVLYFLAFMLGKGYYHGLGLATLIIPFAFFLLRRNFAAALVCLVALLYTGKRGVLIAFFIVILVYLVMQRIRNFSSLAAISGFFFAAVVTASFWALTQIDASNPTLAKLNLVNPLSEDTDFEIGSGGRLTEILRAYEAFAETPLGWISGAGMGFTYEWWSDTGAWDYEPARHYLHMSYLNYLFQYGAPLTLGLLALLYRTLAAGYTFVRDRRENLASCILFLYVIGKLAQAVFGFVLSSDPLLWAALGILAQRTVADGQPRRAAVDGRATGAYRS